MPAVLCRAERGRSSLAADGGSPPPQDLHPGKLLLADPEHPLLLAEPGVPQAAQVQGAGVSSARRRTRASPRAVNLVRNLVSVPGRGSSLLISLIIYSVAAVGACTQRAASNWGCSFLL